MLQMNRLLTRYKGMADRVLNEDIIYRPVIFDRFLLFCTILFLFKTSCKQPVGDENQYGQNYKPYRGHSLPLSRMRRSLLAPDSQYIFKYNLKSADYEIFFRKSIFRHHSCRIISCNGISLFCIRWSRFNSISLIVSEPPPVQSGPISASGLRTKRRSAIRG